MKKIALYGASGKTGSLFLEKALDKGYHINALVRNPDKLDIENKALNIIKGDLLDAKDLEKSLDGVQAVACLAGHVKGSPPNLQEDFITKVLPLLEKKKIKRILLLIGAGVRDPKLDRPGFMDRLIPFIMKNLAGSGPRNALLDGRKHVELIRQREDLDWTVVRAPMLTDKPETNHTVVGSVGSVKGIKLTRADLAQFILEELEHGKYIQQMPFVTND